MIRALDEDDDDDDVGSEMSLGVWCDGGVGGAGGDSGMCHSLDLMATGAAAAFGSRLIVLDVSVDGGGARGGRNAAAPLV